MSNSDRDALLLAPLAARALRYEGWDDARTTYEVLDSDGSFFYVCIDSYGYRKTVPSGPHALIGGGAFVIDLIRRLAWTVDPLFARRPLLRMLRLLLASEGRPWRCELIADWSDARKVMQLRSMFDWDMNELSRVKSHRRNLSFLGIATDIEWFASELRKKGCECIIEADGATFGTTSDVRLPPLFDRFATLPQLWWNAPRKLNQSE